MEEVKKYIKKECLPWIISPFNKLRSLCIICQALFWDPGTYQSTRQNSIPIRNVFTTCKERDPYAPEYLLWSYGVFTYFGPVYPRETQIPFSNITANFLLILLHRLQLQSSPLN